VTLKIFSGKFQSLLSAHQGLKLRNSGSDDEGNPQLRSAQAKGKTLLGKVSDVGGGLSSAPVDYRYQNHFQTKRCI
jgi:hypothetical protein